MRYRMAVILPAVVLTVLIAGCASSASPMPTTPPIASLTPSPTLSPSPAAWLPVPVGTWAGTREPGTGSTPPWWYTVAIRECAVSEPCGEWEYATTREGEQVSCGGTLQAVGMGSSPDVTRVDAYYVFREQVTWKRGSWQGCKDADMYLAPLPNGTFLYRGYWEPSDALSPPLTLRQMDGSATHDLVDASVFLHGGGFVDLSDPTDCAGAGLAADIHSGAEVTVSDAAGVIVGRGVLSKGVAQQDPVGCRLWIRVDGLPESPRYSVTVGDRSLGSFSFEQMFGNWGFVIP